MSAAAAIPAEPIPAVTYLTAPAAGQQMYVTSQPQEVVYMTQPAYTIADGQTMMMAGSQMIGGSAAAPPGGVTYEYAPAPVSYAAPTVYSISPERFAQIAAGIPLTQEEINSMLGGGAPPEAPAPLMEPAMQAAGAVAEAAVAAVAPAAAGSAKADKKSKKKSSAKGLKASSKKKKAGCC